MTLRYGAVVSSLRSLLGAPAITEVAPSETSRYRTGGRIGAIAPLADIYVPDRPTGASVVLVHGGGFVIGSRRMKPMRYLAARLVAENVAVCAIDYRMIFRGGGLDEAITDVSDAFAWWVTRVPQLGLDRDAISLAGLSAGATLSYLAAARLGSAVAGVACCFGLYEVDHLRGPAALLPRLLFGTADREAWTARSPRFAAQPAAPVLLLHGDDDGLVPVAQARRLAAHRQALGLPTRLVVYEATPHGFFNLTIAAAAAGARELVRHVAQPS